jgi:hypothetical protein
MNVTFLSPKNPHYTLVAVIEPISHVVVAQLLFLLQEESCFSCLYRNEVLANMGRVIVLLRSGSNQNQHVMVGDGGTIPSSQRGRSGRVHRNDARYRRVPPLHKPLILLGYKRRNFLVSYRPWVILEEGPLMIVV